MGQKDIVIASQDKISEQGCLVHLDIIQIVIVFPNSLYDNYVYILNILEGKKIFIFIYIVFFWLRIKMSA